MDEEIKEETQDNIEEVRQDDTTEEQPYTAPKEENVESDDIPKIPYRKEDSKTQRGTCAVRGGKLHTYDWLEDLPTPPNPSDLVEVQFKNTRKGYFRNSAGIQLKKGDIVAVEASPGHDIGEVTLMGRLVYLQMHKNHINPTTYPYKRIYRVARQTDIEKWEEAKGLEHTTMLEARQIAQDLHLNMKIGDVEYQGDRTKAIFYYIADERVDFRELIKVLADHFRVRIEMRQIGARQEAGRIGGIGPCGRELCCASWLTNFISVSTHSARVQDLSLNPTKLAGQCGKLKCCLNFELSAYVDAISSFPPTDKPLETAAGDYYFYKYDIFKRLMWYSPQKDSLKNVVAVEADRVRLIQEMNTKGERPDDLGGLSLSVESEDDGYYGPIELEDDLTRFDSKGDSRNRRRGQNGRNNRQDGNRQGGNRNGQNRRGQGETQGNNQNGGQNGAANQKPKNQQGQQQGQQQQGQQGQQQGQQQRRQDNGDKNRQRRQSRPMTQAEREQGAVTAQGQPQQPRNENRGENRENRGENRENRGENRRDGNRDNGRRGDNRQQKQRRQQNGQPQGDGQQERTQQPQAPRQDNPQPQQPTGQDGKE
jgi:cell fate regulator YaaT (PSP1 superfamily)